jgi:hypothetical protein
MGQHAIAGEATGQPPVEQGFTGTEVHGLFTPFSGRGVSTEVWCARCLVFVWASAARLGAWGVHGTVVLPRAADRYGCLTSARRGVSAQALLSRAAEQRGRLMPFRGRRVSVQARLSRGRRPVWRYLGSTSTRGS